MSYVNNGYLRPTVLWHLLEEGEATVMQLAALSGITGASIRDTVRDLVADGFIHRNGNILALTPDGIDVAAAVDEARVEHAIQAVRHGHVAA
jgi:DNA-binding HxlR family transcriptional regulator